MKHLKVIEFMKTHENWQELLASPPYFLKITTEGEYTILKYNQISSDFTNEIVRECRGLIIDSVLRPVCIPFFKFGNYGENYCPEIDWESAQVQEKIDGSLIKLWFDRGAWHISTNGTINAHTAPLHDEASRTSNVMYHTFGELFDIAAQNAGLNPDRLNKENTYMFELVSPFNRVVVPYHDISIYHLGTRNNSTLEELEEDIGICKPKSFPLATLDDCVAAAAALPYDKEGYVVVDRSYNRVKIKSPKYVAVAYIKNYGDNEAFLARRVIDIIRNNEVEEFLTYCAEYADVMHDIQHRINAIINRMEETAAHLAEMTFATQKDFALHIKNDPDRSYLFVWRKSGITAGDYLWQLPNDKIERMIL